MSGNASCENYAKRVCESQVFTVKNTNDEILLIFMVRLSLALEFKFEVRV